MPSASPLTLPSVEPSLPLPPFPSPTLFSILPQIYLLLSHIEPLQQHAGTILPTTPGGNSALAPITLQELPAAIQPIKTQILKAKAAVQALPDVERTVGEQDDEIRMLERRIKALRGRLGELGERAKREVKEEDVVMRGVES